MDLELVSYRDDVHRIIGDRNFRTLVERLTPILLHESATEGLSPLDWAISFRKQNDEVLGKDTAPLLLAVAVEMEQQRTSN